MNYLILERKGKKIIKHIENIQKNEFNHVDAYIYMIQEWNKVKQATVRVKLTVYDINTKKIIFNSADVKLMKKEIKRMEEEEKEKVDNALIEYSKKQTLLTFLTPLDLYGYKHRVKGVCWHQYYVMKTVFASREQIDGLLCGRGVNLAVACVNKNCKRGVYFCGQHMCDIIEKKTYQICLHCMMELLYHVHTSLKSGCKKIEPMFGVEIIDYSLEKTILSIKNLFKIICEVVDVNIALMEPRAPLDKFEKRYVKTIDIYSQMNTTKHLPLL